MIRLFFAVAMLCLALAGCGGVEWFPEPTVIPGADGATLNVTPFSFAPKTKVTAGDVQTSDPVTISMTGGPAKITVSTGGSYKINSGEFTSAEGTIKNSDQVTVRHTHTAAEVQVATTLTIGDESATFVSTTADSVTDVPAFTFTPKTNFTVGSEVISDGITVDLGSATSAPISVVNGQYSIGTAAFTSAAGTVNDGVTLRVRHTPTTTGQTVSTVTIGGRSATFVSTTVTVAAFTLNPSQVSAAVNSTQVAGVTLSITGGTAPISVATTSNSTTTSEYSINGGIFTTAAGTVKNGDQVRVRHQASSISGRSVTTELTIGDKKALFTSTTTS